jgi:hypothetical protein
MTTPTYSDRLALAMCRANSDLGQCANACEDCRFLIAAVVHELAAILRERHGDSSQVADLMDGIGCHPETVQTVQGENDD